VDEDTLLTLAGAALVVFVLGGLVVAGLAATTAPDRAADLPEAEWTAERVNGTHVRIAHAGGEAVAAEELLVRAEGYRRRTNWDGLVTEGDSTAIEASEGQVVRLKWTGASPNVEDELARWQV
jgi:hypothetical protein